MKYITIKILVTPSHFKRLETLKRLAGVSWRAMLIEGAREMAKRVPSQIDVRALLEGIEGLDKEEKRAYL